MLFISMLVLEKIFVEGSNYPFYLSGYTLFVTLQKLAYFSQLTFLWPNSLLGYSTVIGYSRPYMKKG